MSAGYLDAASSEPLHPVARETWLAAADSGWADPRRLHHDGRSARLLLDNAREVIAECLGARPDEITFTSSGTDAIHRGLSGLARGRARQGTGIAYGAVEHSAVLHTVRWLEAPTAEIPVDRLGRVHAGSVVEAVRGLSAAAGPGVGLVAVQTANHEVGTVQPIDEIATALAAEFPDVPLFIDAAVSVGRLPLPARYAVAAASAHKWGGPAGVGVLCVRKGVRWRNALPADDRVEARASGFENVPSVLAAAAALQAVTQEREETSQRQSALIAKVRERVTATIPDVEVVGDPHGRLPHLVTFSCLYVDGEALVTELDRRGFGVASGSACTASTLTPSHVLAAMGVLTHGNVRLSLTLDTTEEVVDGFLQALPKVVAEIRSRVGL